MLSKIFKAVVKSSVKNLGVKKTAEIATSKIGREVAKKVVKSEIKKIFK